MTLKGEGVEKVQTTDANGVTVFDDLRVGDYTVTEKLQDGWVNVTSLTQNAKIEKEDCEVIVMFANKKKEVPVVPEGEVTPIPVTPTSLPVTGPEAAAMGGFGTLSLLGAVGYLRRGKKLLNDNFRKIK
jgi:hypothetical protein